MEGSVRIPSSLLDTVHNIRNGFSATAREDMLTEAREHCLPAVIHFKSLLAQNELPCLAADGSHGRTLTAFFHFGFV